MRPQLLNKFHIFYTDGILNFHTCQIASFLQLLFVQLIKDIYLNCCLLIFCILQIIQFLKLSLPKIFLFRKFYLKVILLRGHTSSFTFVPSLSRYFNTYKISRSRLYHHLFQGAAWQSLRASKSCFLSYFLSRQIVASLYKKSSISLISFFDLKEKRKLLPQE